MQCSILPTGTSWNMGKTAFGDYTFKQISQGADHYLAKCSSCVNGGAPVDMVFAHLTGVNYSSRWRITHVGLESEYS